MAYEMKNSRFAANVVIGRGDVSFQDRRDSIGMARIGTKPPLAIWKAFIGFGKKLAFNWFAIRACNSGHLASRSMRSIDEILSAATGAIPIAHRAPPRTSIHIWGIPSHE
ncbi:hypothetical protein EN833_18750 [Mesorhizobium sp. M4B.F.Ca.ET.190.01.1.1]|uniref:hypothetical protein n=1 Tax=unclassified Mesorhizobium TaxID=325217 RepID=UPI0010928C52|nr:MULTISPECIES: hypothetical protein [unclassified Mesorhizobium]TGR08197.1 hypothetical protein EN843_18745 [Mesorhizobium sp. M4B.F.Ca.ET.200.01.1.1]TGS17553.1 hypothetical protein EN833_18750 [Mesorhizobium sp. M4B.F.Ca.ET.190.01.1.1]TGT29878.1 hypothetical protein EN815_18730 [Mesorhizobium sp. M4B.F.Ca.ET.172.01.1.1]